MKFDWERYKSELEGVPEWGDPAELSLQSFRSFIRDHATEPLAHSIGYLRLTGDGISGQSGPIEGVSGALSMFQKLVRATGLARTGKTSLRGSVPSEIAEKTRLNLTGAPNPGSIILQIEPSMSPEQEFAHEDQNALWENEERVQLVDLAMDDALRLLDLGRLIPQPNEQREFTRLVGESGPRVASALRDFTASLKDYRMEPTVSWERQTGKSTRVSLDANDLTRITLSITGSQVDREPTTIQGVVRTVSDVSSWLIQLANGKNVSVNASSIRKQDIAIITVGMAISINVHVIQHSGPASEDRTEYRAIGFNIIDNEISSLRNKT